MKVITREHKYTTTVFVAEDGKEFNSEAECRNYERDNRKEILLSKLKECKEASGYIGFGDMYGSEDHDYRWFYMRSEEDVENLKEAFGFSDYDMGCVNIGDWVCVESTYDDDYITTLYNGIDYVQRLLGHLGYDIEIKPREDREQ